MAETSIPEWQQRQSQASQSLLQQGSEALREGNLELAQAALTESAIILDMAPASTVEVRRLRAQAFNELGVVHQRRDDLASSRNFHHQAAELCRGLIDEGVEGFRGNSAATHLNLANICAAMGDRDAAIEAMDVSEELVGELLEEGAEVRNMAVAVYMTRASLEAAREEFDAGDEAMERALALAKEAIEEGNTGLYVQITQGAQQLSVILYQAEEFERALRWGQRAEELSEEAFEELGQDVVNVYIVSQINLISFNEEMDQFADAEDSLWKAIDLVGDDPRLLKRGKDFYEQCRKQADARLEAGNLPRQEVNEGLEDVLARIESIGGLPEELEMPDSENVAEG